MFENTLLVNSFLNFTRFQEMEKLAG